MTQTIGNINNFKCVEDREEFEWRTNWGVIGTAAEYRTVSRLIYEVTLQDGQAKPALPVNPGGLVVGSQSGGWTCEDRGVTDPYGARLKRVYHETWVKRSEWSTW